MNLHVLTFFIQYLLCYGMVPCYVWCTCDMSGVRVTCYMWYVSSNTRVMYMWYTCDMSGVRVTCYMWYVSSNIHVKRQNYFLFMWYVLLQKFNFHNYLSCPLTGIPPEFLGKPDEVQYGIEGRPSQIIMRLRAYPEPKITWYFHNMKWVMLTVSSSCYFNNYWFD